VARDSADILTDDPPPAADERIQYAVGPLRFGDLRVPEGEGPHPLAVVVHGGAWKATYNLIHTGHLCVALARAGIASWNVEYRRVGDPGGGWPGSLDDVVLALRHARGLPGIDPGRVVAVGHSAGGHLALLAVRQVRIRGVVALAAVTDPETWDNPAVEGFFGGPVPAGGAPRRLLPLGVPQVLVHGTADDVVPFEQSRAYASAAGAEARLVPLDGAGHFEPIDPQADEFTRALTAIGALFQP
jgi:acetyl esterase/lipase